MNRSKSLEERRHPTCHPESDGVLHDWFPIDPEKEMISPDNCPGSIPPPRIRLRVLTFSKQRHSYSFAGASALQKSVRQSVIRSLARIVARCAWLLEAFLIVIFQKLFFPRPPSQCLSVEHQKPRKRNTCEGMRACVSGAFGSILSFSIFSVLGFCLIRVLWISL